VTIFDNKEAQMVMKELHEGPLARHFVIEIT
jgi:hypothetical protein